MNTASLTLTLPGGQSISCPISPTIVTLLEYEADQFGTTLNRPVTAVELATLIVEQAVLAMFISLEKQVSA